MVRVLLLLENLVTWGIILLGESGISGSLIGGILNRVDDQLYMLNKKLLMVTQKRSRFFKIVSEFACDNHPQQASKSVVWDIIQLCKLRAYYACTAVQSRADEIFKKSGSTQPVDQISTTTSDDTQQLSTTYWYAELPISHLFRNGRCLM